MNNKYHVSTHIRYILVSLLSITVIGCQSLQPKSTGELAMEDQDFLGIWDAYNHCVDSSDIQHMQANLDVLASAPKPISLDDSPIPVPAFLKKWSTARGSRLAVDPRAMAASCSIHLAEVAQLSADWPTALRTFQEILKNYPEPQYAFYVSKANHAMEQLTTVRPVSLSFQEALVD
ncbi:hypothetical protein [Candidatus Nitrospira allomarina]|jgi:hypothetical protein|uniref:Outer membrane lipoprotein BamD-like domain-containing protein n=1 Tax=Candidatus Nitrospira allomarina TaxID=3020900 RepID=A0AA96GE70_9BACT|nr:hypothetical protein [Candidatus Nitrospira allomarina]WNM57258.1 hypothetical protein PP769_14925 [Candidatus Nitrospira allomarina]